MPEKDTDKNIVDYFKPYFKSVTFYSWLREPDFCDDYMERWRRDNEISINAKPQRFELASFYRLVRDERYVRFLKSVGVKTVQLTFFGTEEATDDRESLIRKVVDEDILPLNLARKITVGEMIEKFGDFSSERVFEVEDYFQYLLNLYAEKYYTSLK